MRARTISLIVVALVGITYYSYRRNLIALDGIQGELLMLIARPETRYAKHYTHKNFAKVQIGMTEQDVVKRLGQPLIKWQPYKYTIYRNKAHYTGLQYSESPSSTHYRLRQVYLDGGKVAEIIAYYYLD